MKLPKGYKLKKDNKLPYFGETDTEKKIIKINVKKNLAANKKKGKRKDELKDSLLHEKYHAAHPSATEKETYKATTRMMKKDKLKKDKTHGWIAR